MTEINISIPDELADKMKNHPETNWGNIASTAIKNHIQKLINAENEQEIEELTKISEYSLKEFLENEPDLYTDDDLKIKYHER